MTKVLAWTDYLYWQGQNKKTLKRINKLITDAQRHPFEDLGQPELERACIGSIQTMEIIQKMSDTVAHQKP